MTAYTIRPSRLSDLGEIVKLRVEAEQWLEEHNIRQWTSDYTDYSRTTLQRAVEDGAAWVVVDHGGDVVATASLSSVPDPDFWGWMDLTRQADALYIGKMIVGLRVRGVGLADAILNWACLRATDTDRTQLRLEVRRDNTRLQDYYLNRGFQHVRTWHRPERRTESGWLAQRPVDVVLSTPVVLEHTSAPIAAAPVGITPC